MNHLNKRTDLVKYAVLLAAGLCANDALAFGNLGADVDQICAQAGNSLEGQFQPAVNNNCTACHNDGNGGNGAGKTAFLDGNAAIIELFCPGAQTPAPTPTPTPTCTDADGDNFAAEGGNCLQMDCNDGDSAIHPGATENCTDRIDNNCNDLIDALDPNARGCPECTDADGDGYNAAAEGGECGPVDCDDGDPAMNPGVSENCNDGFDNNCDANADAVDAACQAMNEDDDEEEDRRDRGDEEEDRDRGGDEEEEEEDEEDRDRDRGDEDEEEDHADNDDDDDDERRDSRRRGRGSRDRD
jgi:hypothetical protein